MTPGASYYYANGRTISNYAGRQGSTVYDNEGKTVTSSSPSFEENGKIIVIDYLQFVLSVNGGAPFKPINCSPTEIKSRVNLAIELVRAQSNARAIDELVILKGCF